MTAIFRRELYAYFSSITGYIFISVLYFFSGIFFWTTCIYPGNANMSSLFANILLIVVFLMPIVTMRLMSEEFKQRTDQLLLTSPVRLTSIIIGKYLSALFLYLIGISIIMVSAGVISIYTVPDWIVILGNFIGLFLLGGALISIGLFISSLTESQVVAAVVSYAAALLIMLIDGIANFFSGNILGQILSYMSFSKHFRNFTLGILNIEDLVFFVSICILFIFLTVQMLEKKRWI